MCLRGGRPFEYGACFSEQEGFIVDVVHEPAQVGRKPAHGGKVLLHLAQKDFGMHACVSRQRGVSDEVGCLEALVHRGASGMAYARAHERCREQHRCQNAKQTRNIGHEFLLGIGRPFDNSATFERSILATAPRAFKFWSVFDQPIARYTLRHFFKREIPWRSNAPRARKGRWSFSSIRPASSRAIRWAIPTSASWGFGCRPNTRTDRPCAESAAAAGASRSCTTLSGLRDPGSPMPTGGLSPTTFPSVWHVLSTTRKWGRPLLFSPTASLRWEAISTSTRPRSATTPTISRARSFHLSTASSVH